MAKSEWTGNRARPIDAVGESGFSLLEVLFATTILIVGVASLANLFAVSTKSNTSARSTTTAALLATQKMEQLRGLQWGFDTLGLPLSDTTSDTTVVPENPTGGTGLSPSPSGTLGSNTVGYVDYLDANGVSLGGASTTPPTGAIFIRRWSVEPLPTNPNNTLVLQILVTRNKNRGSADTATGVTRLPDEARLVSIKTRKAT